MKKFFNFQFVSATTRLNNILRLATLAAAFLALPMHALAQSNCPEDLNFDRVVNGADTMIVMDAFGNCPASPASCPADLNGDRVVNVNDVFIVLDAYGNCPVAAPTIISVSPNSGPRTGGTAITIIGTNLTGSSRVQVGGVNATRVVPVNDTTVTAVTPAGTEGLADVTVTAAGQTVTRTNAFTYKWYTVLQQIPSFAVVPNETVRTNIIATGLPWYVQDIGTGIKMLLVPPGIFNMGCNAFDSLYCYSDESPRHQVKLTRAFYLGKTEVTQKQWQDKMGNNPSDFKGKSDSPSRPVETVSWNDIAGVAGFNSKTGLRLPTEAEWEYACRGGTTTAIHSTPDRPNGSNKIAQLKYIAWYTTNSGFRTHNVGGKNPNGFGFYDMSGNVWEWVSDWYGRYSAGNATDPAGPSTGTSRVARGGAWNEAAFYSRSSLRGIYDPVNRYSGVGFRAARTP
jgi:formylglycine-generating enzyme required for sulfatase activity